MNCNQRLIVHYNYWKILFHCLLIINFEENLVTGIFNTLLILH